MGKENGEGQNGLSPASTVLDTVAKLTGNLSNLYKNNGTGGLICIVGSLILLANSLEIETSMIKVHANNTTTIICATFLIMFGVAYNMALNILIFKGKQQYLRDAADMYKLEVKVKQDIAEKGMSGIQSFPTQKNDNESSRDMNGYIP